MMYRISTLTCDTFSGLGRGQHAGLLVLGVRRMDLCTRPEPSSGDLAARLCSRSQTRACVEAWGSFSARAEGITTTQWPASGVKRDHPVLRWGEGTCWQKA
jgi:hypothetical protein